MTRRPGAATAVLLGSLLVLAACAGPPGAGPAGPGITPGPVLASPNPRTATAAEQLDAALADAGLSLEEARVPYRPGEPATVQPAPRAVFRVALADPGEGFLVIYDLGSADAAARAGRDFAAYLGTGVGMTNYPRDAQFALSQVGATLAYFWWSPERSSSPASAEAAYEVIRGVGQPIEISR